jgi:SagB-type dehydrogenase family enzyme
VSSSLLLSIREDISVEIGAEGEIVFQSLNARVAFKHVSAAIRAAVQQLLIPGAREDRLTDTFVQVAGAGELPRLYFYLQRLTQLCALCRSAQADEMRLATVTPISGSFVFHERKVLAGIRYVISKFAYMRRLDGKLVAESPLVHARLTLHDWRAAALIVFLAQPCSAREIPVAILGLTDDALNQMLILLVGAGFAQELNEDGRDAEDANPALRTWEFHDLLFHARSRDGRHDNPIGASFRFVGQLDCTPAVKPNHGTEFMELHRPDLARLQREDPPFAQVQEMRCSRRAYNDQPITAEQLGEFLFRVGRIRRHEDLDVETPSGSVRMDFAMRPYPAGGALYELELYVVVNNCVGLGAGMYYYDPLRHRLAKISGRTPEVDVLLRSASSATTIPVKDVQVLLIVAARFQRIAWKYSTMAYAATLKHVGVLFQTMYLAATAMGLAPCAVGSGDSDAFARAAGTEYIIESSVGEFLLGSG